MGIPPFPPTKDRIGDVGSFSDEATVLGLPVPQTLLPLEGLLLSLNLPEISCELQQLLSSGSLGVEGELNPDVLPDMKDTALGPGTGPAPTNGQQDSFLTITDHHCGSR